jgi:hypothetical protein
VFFYLLHVRSDLYTLRSKHIEYRSKWLAFRSKPWPLRSKTPCFRSIKDFPSEKIPFNCLLNSISHKKMTPKVEIHAFGSFIDKKLKFFYLFTCFSSHSRCFCWVNGSKRMFRRRIDRVDFYWFISCIGKVVPFSRRNHDGKVVISFHLKV